VRHRAFLLVLSALALSTGCNKGARFPAFQFQEPTSIAIFRGYSHVHPGELMPYAAVANTAFDDVVLFDPVDDEAVPAPILIRPLSIPVPNPRPALIASAPFITPPQTDAATPVPERPDLLVVVSASSTKLQLVRTWKDPVMEDPGLVTDASGNAITVDLGGQAQALLATPTVDASGNILFDRVTVVAALPGGLLSVVEYLWTPDPTDPTNGAAAPLGEAVVQPLGFEALSLAVDASLVVRQDDPLNPTPDRVPRNPSFLYAGTLDPIPPSNVLGVAQLDMRGTPGAWSVAALDAHAPTTLVAAYSPAERVTGVLGAYDQVTAPETIGPTYRNAFNQDASGNLLYVPRVYAFLAPGACGPQTPLACGIAVLDPSTGDVLENPWHPGETPKQYLPPIAVASPPLAMAPGRPPLNPPPTDNGGLENDELMFITGNSFARLTTGVLFLPSADGRSYYADLARWEIPNDGYEVSQLGSPTQVGGYGESTSDLPRIGFYEPVYLAQADVANGNNPRADWAPDSTAVSYFQVTPGFTQNDIFTVTYQGYLPSFSNNQPVLVEDAGNGQLRVAFQSTLASAITQVVDVYDPALGVRAGDIVEFWTAAIPACPDTTTQDNTGQYLAPIEGKIVEIDLPDLAHPGGSLVVEKGDCVAIAQGILTSCDSTTHGPWTTMDACWPAAGWAPGSPPPVIGPNRFARVRGSGGTGTWNADGSGTGFEFVVVGVATGYAGRAVAVSSDAQRDPLAFQFANDGEATLVAACPLIPYPSDPLAVQACDATCRQVCENAAIARRARRQHLTSVECYEPAPGQIPAGSKTFCQTFFSGFALPAPAGQTDNPPFGTFDGEPPAGPALAFSLGLRQPTATSKELLVRDTQVAFSTRSGYTPTSRYAGGAAGGAPTLPRGVAYFDRTADPSWAQEDRARFFVPYVGNLTLDASPSKLNNDTRVLH